MSFYKSFRYKLLKVIPLQLLSLLFQVSSSDKEGVHAVKIREEGLDLAEPVVLEPTSLHVGGRSP